MNYFEARLADTADRFARLRTAFVFDVLDEMGLSDRCLDLGIKPLGKGARIAGPAFTIAFAADARLDWEYDNEEARRLTYFRRMYRGCVVLVTASGEDQAAQWSALMSVSARARGAAGVIVDGGIRDGCTLMAMRDWPVFTRYLSPIDPRGRMRIRAIEEPVAVRGTLTRQVRVVPGDWLVGDMDGVVAVPAGQLDEVLRRAEEIGQIDEIAREEIRKGADAAAVFEKYGRL
jgi:regulator of RNase E activity RraA